MMHNNPFFTLRILREIPSFFCPVFAPWVFGSARHSNIHLNTGEGKQILKVISAKDTRLAALQDTDTGHPRGHQVV